MAHALLQHESRAGARSTRMAKGSDTQGAPAADRPKDLSTGEHAEKGDARRPFRQHHGTTRQSTRQDTPPSDNTADAQQEPKQGYVGPARGAGARAPECAAQRAGTCAPGAHLRVGTRPRGAQLSGASTGRRPAAASGNTPQRHRRSRWRPDSVPRPPAAFPPSRSTPPPSPRRSATPTPCRPW